MRPTIPAILLLSLGCSGKDPKEGPPDTSTVVSTDPLAELTQSGPVTCSNPDQRELAPWVRTQTPSPESDLAWIYAGGAIAADLDQDGNLDVVAPNTQPEAQLYLGTSGPLFAERDDVLAPFDLSHGTGGTAVDYDGDGDLDLYITRYDQANVLLRNDGDLVFTDVTEQAGVDGCDPDDCYRTLSSSWADFDRDGDLDLIAGNYGYVPHDGTLAPDLEPGEPSFLYRNEGDGTFTDISEDVFPRDSMKHVHDGFTYISSFLDLDRDGFPELYFINDFGTAYKNVLFANDGGKLVLDNGRRGLDQEMTGMCLGVHDENADGLPDLHVSVWNDFRYLVSEANYGFWYEVEPSELGLTPVSPQKVPWGCEFYDLDLDGDEDLVQAYGYVRNDGTPAWSNPLMQPDAVYMRGDNGVYQDFAPLWGLDDAQVGRGFLVADFNHDGYGDIFKRDPKGPDVQYMSQCGSGSWLQVELRQPGTLNTFAVGAVVEIDVGGTTQTRWMMAGGRNFASAPPLELHFGLGEADAVDAVRVFWPDGEISTFSDVPCRQRLTITRKTQ